jgi:Fur family ferric uptake transcriptional regulator
MTRRKSLAPTASPPTSTDKPPARPRPAKAPAPKKPQPPAHAHDHAHDHREHARELLSNRGLRITAPRLAVLTVLLDKHRPTSAQELIDAAETQGMDQVTVYRTLNTLVDENIAQAVGTTDRGRRFEVHACEGCRIDHPHLQCRRCARLECLEQGMLPAMLVPTEVGGFLIDEAKLYLYGLCPTCRVATTP